MTYRRQPCYSGEMPLLSEFHTKRKASEWDMLAQKLLIPTPGYTKSIVELVSELKAGGVPVPPGIAMLARDHWAMGWRPELDS